MIQSRLCRMALGQRGGHSPKAPDLPGGSSPGGLDPKVIGSRGPGHVGFPYTVAQGSQAGKAAVA